jgi:putative Mg2+ transporter-C (MgtC) family protein
MQLELWVALRIVVAAVLSGVVGYEREITGKSAGFRTHILVAIGATLFVSANDLALNAARHLESGSSNALQIQVALLSPVQAVATGIGFLGAGMIFVGGHQHRVKGLTTAASIWVTAALGVAVGFDCFLLATLTTIIILVVLHGLMRFDTPLESSRIESTPLDDRPRGV